MYGGKFIEIIVSCKKEFYPYIHDKFRDSSILENKDDTVSVKLNAFEDGLIKWIMSQPVDLVKIIAPKEVKQRIINESNKLITMYMEVHD